MLANTYILRPVLLTVLVSIALTSYAEEPEFLFREEFNDLGRRSSIVHRPSSIVRRPSPQRSPPHEDHRHRSP